MSQRRQIKTTTVKTVNNKNNNNTRRKQKARRRVVKQPGNAIYIAPCTRLYAKALVNPFNVQGNPCIPDTIIIPSFKFSTKCRGSFSTGTLGVGFCVINPFLMLVNDGPVDVPNGFNAPILFTQPTYDQPGITLSTTGIPGSAFANPASLFTTADFTTVGLGSYNRQFRLVGAGLRIRYTGSNFYNQGSVVSFRNQGGDGLLYFPTITGYTDLTNDQYSTVHSITRSEKYIYYVPDNPDLIAYSPYVDFLPSAHGGNNNFSKYSMGFLVAGADVDHPQSWEFEAVAFFEVVGSSMPVTKSDGDPVGHDIILSSLPNTAPSQTPSQVETSVMSKFIDGFSHTTREVAYQAGRLAANTAINMAGNILIPRSGQLMLN